MLSEWIVKIGNESVLILAPCFYGRNPGQLCYDSAVSQYELPSSRLKALLISYVWPEPQSSAAGRRQLDWIRFFQLRGAEVHVASQARLESRDSCLDRLGVEFHSIAANDSGFDEWIARLNPKWVVFDRFVTEEQFGWRVSRQSPHAIRILDTQDLHALRRSRAEWMKSHSTLFCSPSDLPEVKLLLERSEDFLRELAAIHRSDLTLLISPFEERLLREAFRVEFSEFVTLGFAYREDELIEGPSFFERKNFVFIGNFRHEPNLDAVFYLAREIWPKLRKRLPMAELEVFGAYPLKEATELHDPSVGFFVRGHVADSIETLSHARALLAPLRFGAGLKGKITDAWAAGTPVITTPIGAEGLIDEVAEGFGGRVVSSVDDMVLAAIELYENPAFFAESVRAGRRILANRCSETRVFSRFAGCLEQLEEHLEASRQRNWIGRLISREQMRSTEYFSRWIESKNQKGK